MAKNESINSNKITNKQLNKNMKKITNVEAANQFNNIQLNALHVIYQAIEDRYNPGEIIEFYDQDLEFKTNTFGRGIALTGTNLDIVQQELKENGWSLIRNYRNDHKADFELVALNVPKKLLKKRIYPSPSLLEQKQSLIWSEEQIIENTDEKLLDLAVEFIQDAFRNKSCHVLSNGKYEKYLQKTEQRNMSMMRDAENIDKLKIVIDILLRAKGYQTDLGQNNSLHIYSK
jgi:hypothetical protein